MFNTENSGNVGISSNSHLTYTTTNSLTAGDIIESNGAILSAFTEVFAENPYFYEYPTSLTLKIPHGAGQ